MFQWWTHGAAVLRAVFMQMFREKLHRVSGPFLFPRDSATIAYKSTNFYDFRLQKTVADLEEKLSAQSTKFSQSSVAKDLELEALRQQEEKLRVDVAQRTADLER